MTAEDIKALSGVIGFILVLLWLAFAMDGKKD